MRKPSPSLVPPSSSMVGVFCRFSAAKPTGRPPPTHNPSDEKEITNVVKNEQLPPSVVHRVQLPEEFAPVAHPVEPPDYDQPVRCPPPERCIIHDGRLWKERLQLSIKKRSELPFVKESGLDASHRRRNVASSEHCILPSMSAPATTISQLLDSEI